MATEPNVIYTIWYPDYSNSAPGNKAFTDIDRAYAEARASGGVLVELEVDPPPTEEVARYITPGLQYWHVRLGYGENKERASAWGLEPKELHPVDTFSVAPRQRAIVTQCWAASEQDAKKIARERLSRWRALGELIIDEPKIMHGYDYGWRDVPPGTAMPAPSEPTGKGNDCANLR